MFLLIVVSRGAKYPQELSDVLVYCGVTGFAGGVSYTSNCVRTNGSVSTPTSQATSPGDLYIEDIVTARLDLCGGQKVHALQLNTESPTLDITVSGYEFPRSVDLLWISIVFV